MTDKNWPMVPFGEVSVNHDSQRVPVKSSDRRRGPYPYYGASGIIDWVDSFIFDGEYLLIAEDGENLNSRNVPIAFIGDGKFWVNNHAHIVTGTSRALTKYLYYAFLVAEIDGFITGSAQPKLTQSNLNRIKIPLPPIETQREIVFILDSIDQKISKNSETTYTLEEMSQVLFKSWFVDFDPVVAKSEGRKPFGMSDDIAALFPDSFEESELGAVPKGWSVEPFSAVAAKIETGGTPSRQNAAYWNNGAIDWYKTGELFDGPLLGAEEKISEEGLRSSNCKLWEKDTILFALYASPTLGRMGILESPGTANQACAALTAGQDYGQQFLFHSLLTARGELQSISSGAAQQNINLRILREHRTIVPPPTLAVAFESICSVLYQRRRSLSAENQVLAKARDALLPELLGGRIAEATNVTEATAA